MTVLAGPSRYPSHRLAPWLFAAVWLATSSASAQSVPAPVTAPTVLPAAPDPTEATVLQGLSLLHADTARWRIGQGSALLAWGLASTAGGIALYAGPWANDATRSAGIHTGLWGLIDAAIGIPVLVSGLREQSRIGQESALRGPALRRARLRLVETYQGEATSFALNTGLDVAYVTTGAMLLGFGLPRSDASGASWAGAGASWVVQGGVLFAMDIAGWVLAARRAHTALYLGDEGLSRAELSRLRLAPRIEGGTLVF